VTKDQAVSARPITFAVTAGGTGGHLFPAEALASLLTAAGHTGHLLTDGRGKAYASELPKDHRHVVPSETLRGRSPKAALKMGLAISAGFLTARGVLRAIKADVLIGFGGYPTVPPGFAAASLGIPVVLHEANAVLGKANRLLSGRAAVIATAFETLTNATEAQTAKMQLVGNPVRQAVLDAAAPYAPPMADGPLKLLVFGGSQGARVFSDIVPDALIALPEALRARLRLVQQCREEDLDRVRAAYSAAGLEAELAPFFTDLPARMADAHLVVSRSGAGSVAELAAMGRPSVLVPLAQSVEGDQKANAASLEASGGAVVIDQADFTSQRLTDVLAPLLADADALSAMATATASRAEPDATQKLADCVFGVLGRNST